MYNMREEVKRSFKGIRVVVDLVEGNVQVFVEIDKMDESRQWKEALTCYASVVISRRPSTIAVKTCPWDVEQGSPRPSEILA